MKLENKATIVKLEKYNTGINSETVIINANCQKTSCKGDEGSKQYSTNVGINQSRHGCGCGNSSS